MPLEISEIGVRLAVGAPAAPTLSKPDGQGAAPAGGLSPRQVDELVQLCVQQVLDALRRAEGR